MSVAFTKEDSAATASETQLPDRLISEHPNLVTEAGLKLLHRQLAEAKQAYEIAQRTVDVDERRRLSAIPLRDTRYLVERVRTAQIVDAPEANDAVVFGSTVVFSRSDGRIQKFKIVGEDEADPKTGSISFVSPIAQILMGKPAGEVIGTGEEQIEIIEIG